MSYKRIPHFLSLLALLLATTLGCRQQDDPLPSPTAEPPDVAQPTQPSVSQPDNSEADWPPQVVYRSPLIGQQALLDGAITVRFDQPMDQPSVAQAFAIEPTVTGDFTWTRADTLVFTPQATLERAQTYRISIDKTAQGVNGQTLRQPVDFAVQTVGFLEVSQLLPADGASEVASDNAITVLFNRPVVPLVATQDQDDLPTPITITPEIAGRGEWVSTSIYRFTPSAGFEGGTNYSVTVNEGLTDVAGGVLAQAVTSRFSTAPPQVLNTQPAPNQRLVAPTQPISITFNMPMDTDSTAAAITLSPNTAVEYRWNAEQTSVGLYPRERLALETDYTVTINNAARAASGQATLDRAYEIPFQTVPFPAIVQTDPRDGEQGYEAERGCINIEFASPMAWDTVEAALTVIPAPEREIEYGYYEGGTWFTACFPMQFDSDYRVTIAAEAADPYGHTLGEAYSFSYTTGNARPLAALNLPGGVNYFSTLYPQRPDIVHRNVESVDIELYAAGLPVPQLLEQYAYEPPPTAELLAQRTIPLEAAVNELGVTPLDLAPANDGFLPTGVYYLRFKDSQAREEYEWQHHLLIVGDTNLVVKEMVDAVYVWATDIETGQPAPNRLLAFYNTEVEQIGTAETDANGLARIDYTPTDSYLSGVLVISETAGEVGFGLGGSRWHQSVGPWEFRLTSELGREAEDKTYLFTDRPLYRPGDTVYFRGAVRAQDYGRYQPTALREVRLDLQAQGYFPEGQPLTYQETLTLSDQGAFDSQIELPDGLALGVYNLVVQDARGNWLGTVSFTVAEFRKPEFEVSVSAPQPELLRGTATQVDLQATYFFGGSAADLPVSYIIYEDRYLLETDLPYSFSDEEEMRWFFGEPSFGPDGYYGNYLSEGQGRTDATGRLSIPLPANLLDDAPAGSRRLTVEATVLDVNNQPVANRTQIIAHAAEGYVGIAPEQYIGQAGQENQVNLITVDWQAEPLADHQVDVFFFRRDWVRNDEGIWEPNDVEVANAQLTTDGEGQGTASFVPEEGGTYRAQAIYRDAAGRVHASSAFFWVTGSSAFWRPQVDSKQMELVLDKTTYEVGETARLLVQSPFEGPVQAWLTIERGRLIEQRLITLQSNSDTLDTALPASYAPNVHVTLVVVKGVDESQAYGDIRLGMVEIPITPAPLLLNLTLTPNESSYQPGQTAVFDLRVTDDNGNPVQADLSLALVDQALLSLLPDNAQPIGEAFYAPQPYRSVTGASLVISAEGLEVTLEEQATDQALGGGVAVLEEAEFALADSAVETQSLRAANAPLATTTPSVGGEAAEVRTDFRDTAYWEAQISTDGSGQATVEIPLPDNLTTWQLHVKGITAETLVGQASQAIIVAKPLLLRPITPRFFTVGDVASIGTVVNNNSASAQTVEVALEAQGVVVNGEAVQTVTVPAQDSAVVRWEVLVDDREVRLVDLTFTAVSDEYSDATKPTFGIAPDQLIPVYRFNAEDIVATSGVLDDEARRVEGVLLPEQVDQSQGSLRFDLNASLAAAVLDSLQALEYEFHDDSCAHGVAHRLLPNAVTALTLRQLGVENPELQTQLDALVPEAVARLTELQQADGGWGWCATSESNPWLSAYTLLALDKADEAGYALPDAVTRRAADYLQEVIQEPESRLEDGGTQANFRAFAYYVLAEVGQPAPAEYDTLFEESRPLLQPYGQAFLALAYQLAGGSANIDTLVGDLNGASIVSATGAHWENEGRSNLGTDIRDTAIVLYALTQIDPDTLLGPQAVNWLMRARSAQTWRTTQETVWVLLALNQWMQATGELNADYAYLVTANGTLVGEGAFGRENISQTQTIDLPLDSLDQEEVNFIDLQREGNGTLYYNGYLNTFVPADLVPAINRGLSIQRTYYDAACPPSVETPCEPITEIQAGQQVRVELTIVAEHDLIYAVIEDYLPAGAEAIDPGLQTSPSGIGGKITPPSYRYGYWGWWYFNGIQYRDERVVFTSQFLPRGTYQYSYTLQAVVPGTYQVRPTFGRQEFFPEVNGRAAGTVLTITE